MAASALAKPGTDAGPCNGVCEHRDCAITRGMAEADCAICGEKIGYDVRFYTQDRADNKKWFGNEISPHGTMIKFSTDGPRDKQLVHAVCLEGKYRLEREAKENK